MPRANDSFADDSPALDVVADLADVAYFQVDADRNVVAISPAMERLSGFQAHEVLGRSCLDLNRCEECLNGCAVFRHGALHDARLKLFRADGSEMEVVKSGRVFRDENGNVTGAVEVVRPVAEDAAPPRPPGPPPQVDMMLSGLGRLFLLVDKDFRVVAHGASLAELTNLPGERILGMPLEDLLGTELFGTESGFRAAVESGDRMEGWAAGLKGADGTMIPVSVTIGQLDPAEPCGGLEGRYVLMMRPEKDLASPSEFHGMVSHSTAMQRIFRLVELLADNDSTVLVTGESGTGKELVARALHATSHRRNGPFVAVNCAAIPPELLESELFGHVRGAFTGAVKDRAGRFELADGGTLFLDEIGDLALSLQAKILRFLQERAFERVGESRTRTVDVRVIAATHVNLVRAVSERRFREDLYYRLRVVPLHVPALRERREDLELLIRHLLQGISRERGRALRLAPPASRALLTYPWPGNVRELKNALEYATAVCEGQTIHVADLPREIGLPLARQQAPPAPSPPSQEGSTGMVLPSESQPSSPAGAPSAPRESHEARRIRAALERSRYRRAEAASILGISRTTLWRKMREHGI